MLVTFDVSKLDKSKEVNCTQAKNIHPINSTFSVLKLDKFKEVNDEHL